MLKKTEDVTAPMVGGELLEKLTSAMEMLTQARNREEQGEALARLQTALSHFSLAAGFGQVGLAQIQAAQMSWEKMTSGERRAAKARLRLQGRKGR